MKVRIYAVNQDTGIETFADECRLDEAIERGDPEYYRALVELTKVGRYWIGGGAAPLSLLMRA